MGDYTEAKQQWHKGHQVPFLWYGLLTIHPRHRHSDICSNTFVNGYATTSQNRHHQAVHTNFTVFTTDVASAFLKTPTDEEVIVQPPTEYYHNRGRRSQRRSTVYAHHPNNGRDSTSQRRLWHNCNNRG
eukprot:5030748-Amphidinium_carterae.2